MFKEFKIKRWHILTAFAIAVLGVCDALYLKSADKKWPEVVHEAALIAVLLWSAEIIILMLLEQDEFLSYAKSIIDQKASPISKFEASVQENGTLVGIVGRGIVKDFAQRHRIEGRRLIVEGQQDALCSYRFFWQSLVERQSNDKKALKVHVVHSLSVDIWRDELSREILDDQERFIKVGGEIKRIFISTESSPTDHEDYMDVIRDMKQRGIKVAYCSRNEFPQDFLMVPRLDIVIKWYGTVMGRHIRSAEYIAGSGREAMEDMERIWRSVEEKAVEV